MEALIILVFLGWFAFWLYTLVDVIRIPEESFNRAQQSKVLWVIGVFIFQFFGVIAYYAVAKPKLKEVKPAG